MVKKMVSPDLLDGIAVFVAVVEAGSFTAVAQVLGHSTSMINKEVSKLEGRLGSRLLNRTTRKLSLTDVGKAYYERSRQILVDAENAACSITQLQEKPCGLLRVNAPMSFGSSHLLGILPAFMHAYLEVTLEVESQRPAHRRNRQGL